MKVKEWISGHRISWPTTEINLTFHRGCVKYHYLTTGSPVPDSKNCGCLAEHHVIEQDTHIRATDTYQETSANLLTEKLWRDPGTRRLGMH